MSQFKRTRAALVVGAIASTLTIGVAPSADAAGVFSNCDSLHTRWAHGVGKRYAVDHTTGTKVRTFYRSTYWYRVAMNKNSRLDADKDGIACEKR